MRVLARSDSPPSFEPDFYARLHGPDGGLINAWLVGREKARRQPDLRARALAGELVPLVWRGGVEKAIKAKCKIGALAYLAAWQGLRDQDLDLDTDAEPSLTCTRYGVTVIFTADVAKLLAADDAQKDDA